MRLASTGSAGTLARNEREARNGNSVKRFEIERASHAPADDGARAPSTNRLVPDRIDFWAKPLDIVSATSGTVSLVAEMLEKNSLGGYKHPAPDGAPALIGSNCT